MDVLRHAPQNKKLKFLLQNSLQTRMAASSVSILAALLCSMDVSAAPSTWTNGSAFDPAKVALDKIPTPVIGLDGDKTWVQAGEVSDALGKSITVEVTDATGKKITGAISQAQFDQLKSVVGDTTILRIDQKTNRLILNWKDFDIGKNSEVKFVQPTTTSLALNKISDSTSPSAIMGKLTANGGVYLINSNGIVFGENSQVNVGSLVASSLDVDDELFLNKSLGDAIKDDKAAFFIKNQNTDAAGDVLSAGVNTDGKVTLTKKTARDTNTIARRGDIAIEDGAQIKSSTLNGVVVVAPNIVNAGEIKTPDGQTILAAAQDDAFVLFSSDPGLRGLLIEVNTGGDVNNLGNIIAERGNVTLAGIAINHSGTIKATTSVDFNGTVRLLARDSLALDVSPTPIKSLEQVSALLDANSTTPAVTVGQSNKNYRVANHGGDVVLGEKATIEVTPELDSKKTAPDAQAQGLSGVEISGRNIELGEKSSITAKGGNVFLEATENLAAAFEVASTSNPTGYQYNLSSKGDSKESTTRITIGKDSVIDVSGVQVDLPMERNVIEVELRGNELADSPLQRGGFLNGKKVLVDVRKGTPLADITAALAAVPKEVGERLTAGGNIKIRSAGDVVTQPNSTLNVSGGGVHYAAGYVATTNLISEGKVINIADADPNRIYSGILGKETATNKRFNITTTFTNQFLSSDRGEFVAAFDQGDLAGSVSVVTQAASLQGNLLANSFTGPNQRQPSKNNSTAGSFNLDVNLQNIVISQYQPAEETEENLLSKVTAYKGAEKNPNGLFASEDLNLSQDIFNKSGFAHYNLTARNGSLSFTKNANLHLADGASLSATAADKIVMSGSIQVAGGNVSLESTQNKGGFIPTSITSTDLNRPITLGSNAIIDTSGKWINDNPLLAGNNSQSLSQLWIDAGTVKLKAAGDLLLDIESSIVANGGGWIDRLGNFVAGKGGNISLSAKLLDSVQPTKEIKAAQIHLPGTLTSFAFNQGGELSLTAPDIIISDLPVYEDTYAKEALVIDSHFFQRGGFSGYNLTAQGSNEWISHFIFDGASAASPLVIKPSSLNYGVVTNLGTLTTNTQLALLPSDSNLLASFGTTTLQNYARNPVNLSFTLADSSDFSLHQNAGARLNNFVVSQGVKIDADPKASISFTSNTSLVFDGVINAHGGKVNLTTNGSQQAAEVDINNLNDVGIWLGKHSVIDVSSAFIQTPPGADGLTAVGKVIDAGKVSLSAGRGFIFAEQAKPTDDQPNQKAVIDVSASAYATQRYVSNKNVGAYIETTMQAAKAGTVSLKAAEGILFDGELRAQGAGYGALGGTLAVELNTDNRSIPSAGVGSTFERYDFSKISFAERKILFTQDLTADEGFIPNGLSSSNLGKIDFIPTALAGEAKFDINKLTAAGFDSYVITSGYTAQPTASNPKPQAKSSTGIGQILFEGNSALVAGRSIELNTTTLGAIDGRGIVIAPYVKLGLANGLLQVVPPEGVKNTGVVSGGKGELLIAAVNAHATQNSHAFSESLLSQKTADILVTLNNPKADGLLSLVGNIATQGADNVTLASAGDIRTTGLLVGDGKGDNARYLGSLAVNKNLTLQADQIYPTTLSEFVFSSGQYDFSKAGASTYNFTLPDASTFSLNKVNAIKFLVEYTDADGNKLTPVTENATAYEAYDFLEGKLGVGDTVVHPDAAGKPTNGKIVEVIADNTGSRNPEGKITILAGGQSAPVQSAAGSLIFDAPKIEQDGTVKAPFGQIVFNSPGAKGSVVMGEGSLTSVSAENTTIPFGELDASGALIYNPYPNPDPKDTAAIFGVRLFKQSPEAKVSINSANVDLQSGATLDLSGGGDLLAYQFVPGPGGSKDVLAAANSGKSFAIIPSLNSQYAAYDPAIYNESGNTNAHTGKGIGEKIYLSGSGDLPAGEYTILPARYALLAGAYLVTPTGDSQVYSQGQQVRRIDGTPIVAGRFLTANTGEYDSQFSGFIVEKGTVAKTRSEYKIAKATDLFAGADANGNHKFSPNDAASLSVAARASLNLEADIIAKTANKGLGSELSITSNNILITDQAMTGSSAVQILVSQLAGFDSILIGGSRKTNNDGSEAIKAAANTVEVAKDTVLAAPNILLVAKGGDASIGATNSSVKLNAGAQVNASGTYGQQANAVTFFGDSLLSVSAGKPLAITQQSTTLGDVQLAKGASVQANNGSVLLLSNNQTLLDGEIKMQGGALTIGAGRVSLGQVDNTVTGLKFTNDALAKLTVDQLQLTSASSIDLFGNVNLNFTDMTLQAGSLRGFAAAGTTATGKADITVTNSLKLLGNASNLPASASVLGTSLGKGDLSFTANKLVLGQGNLAIGGFDQITLNGTTAIVGEGAANIQAFGNKSLTLNSPLLTGMGASNTHLVADGLIKVQAAGTASDATLKSYNGLGSRWNISGQSLDFTGNAVLPSGELSLSATGSSGENLTLGMGAKVDVSGRSITFDDTGVASNGGIIKLNSVSGSVILDKSSSMNISGITGAKGSDAGTLGIQALAGQANLDGTITAASGSNSKGASLDLAIKSITDFSQLIQQVTAGNFSEAFGLRVSTGDLILKSSEQIKAHNISLTADNGGITLAGILDASGDKGQITLNASKDLNLQGTAQLLAASTNADKGGDVFIGTSGGFINIADGVKINVAGNGTVTFRAPRTEGGKIITDNQVGDDVAITLLGQQHLPDMITGAAKVDVDAFKVYNIVAATSEIFNTDVNGNSTLYEESALLTYMDAVPFGAICGNDSGCSALISPASSGSVLTYYPAVAKGEQLPVGALCGDASGCSYSYMANNAGLSVANVETKAFMQLQNAQQMEQRLFGKFTLADAYHLKPELEIRAKNNLVIDQAIDFGEGLGIVQNYGAGNFAFGNDEAGSTWRFNDEIVSEKLFDPLLSSEAVYDRYTNGEAGVLSLRAQGNLDFNATISDGFAKNISYGKLIVTSFVDGTRTELSNETNGWDYHWIAGADLASANTFATLVIGQMRVANNVVLRTSTGNIKATVAGDLLLGSNAAIYTAGRSTGKGVFDDLAKDNGDFDQFDYSILANSTYATNGGSIDVNVGNNIVASGEQSFVTDWLQRAGGQLQGSIKEAFLNNGYLPTTWTVVYEKFKQGLATLGGGDIRISTTNNIENLSVFLPTTGKNTSHYDPKTKTLDYTTANSILIQGGGDLSVDAGGDIISGQYYVAKGKADIKAGGNILAGQNSNALLLEVADSQINLSAGGSVNIASILNPTVARLSAGQVGSYYAPETHLSDYDTSFFTYSKDSRVNISSLSGDVNFLNQLVLKENAAPFVLDGSGITANTNIYPAQLDVRALQGNINVENTGITLFPSTDGALSLLAANNLTTSTKAVINMPDSDPALLPGVINPLATVPSAAFAITTITPPKTGEPKVIDPFSTMHASTPLYTNNPDPVRVIAQNGDISNIRLATPTHAWISAGRDISNVTFEFQNVHENDVSIVKAARDIVFETPRNTVTNLVDSSSATQGIDITGFGRLDVMAGRDISLGASRGIQSIDAQRNPYLLKNGFGEESGADISLFAGIKTAPDYSGFTQAYLSAFTAPNGITSSANLVDYAVNWDVSTRANAERFMKAVSAVTHRDYLSGAKLASISDQELEAFVSAARIDLQTLPAVNQQQIGFRLASTRSDQYAGDLIEFVTSSRFGGERLNTTTLLALPLAEQHSLALAAFKAAPAWAQRELLLQTYFNEVKQGGVQDVSGQIADKEKDGFARSFAAIEKLFPGLTPKKPDEATGSTISSIGDLSLIFSTVQTQQGGDVNLLIPGGGVNVGVAAVGGGAKKDSSALGLIALRNGNINTTVGMDINVNSSRVFALDGGDIMLWSSAGNIDAGRGAKTALSVPPPIINEDGSVNFQAAVAGSGIRNSRFTPNRTPGAVYLFAPVGKVDAGDAGIGSQGDVLIAAQQVIGADNIDVGGISIGIPVTTGVSASVAAAGASATAATDNSSDETGAGGLADALDKRGGAFVTVDILGFDF